MSVRAPAGNVAISKHEACIGRGFAAIDTIYPYDQAYLFHWLTRFENNWKKVSQGAAFEAINADDIRELIVSTPSPKEQTRIADCLSSLDSLITAESRQLDAFKEHKKGLLQQLFPREGERVPRVRFPEFVGDGEWKFIQLKELTTVFADGDWIELKDQSSDGIRLIQTGNIGNGEFLDRIEKARFISEHTFESLGCTEVLPGDCLISRLPEPAGRCCIIPYSNSKMITAVDCTIVRFNESKLIPYVFLAYSQSEMYLREVESKCAGSTRSRIGREQLSKVIIPVPRILEQTRIATCFSSLDDLISAQSRKVETLKTFKQGLMQQMFPSPHGEN